MSPGADYEGVQLKLSTDVADLMESRGILENEVQMVIHDAEASGVKLYEAESDRFLAKKRIGDVTYFVEYRPTTGAAFEVATTYCCKSVLLEE